jgi:uncharacterized membrane protein
MNFIKYFKPIPLSKKVFYIIMAFFGCIYYTTVIGNHYFFRTYTFDYSVYNFAFWNYSHFHISPVPCYNVFQKGPITFMQDHFSLILMYFVPVYWLLNWLTGSYTLLIILVTMILWSGWALYSLIKLKTNDDWLAVISVLYYFLLQGRYSSFDADSNILTIVCCFVPLFLLSFELKKYLVSFILLLLILFSREDMPFWLIFIFITLIIWHWKEKKVLRFCFIGIIISLVYLVLLFKVFIPMCETPNKPYSLFQYSALGKTPLEAFLYCFIHPVETFKLLYINPLPDHSLDKIKTEFYMVYLISGGFLLFLRPQYFIWFIPLIAQKMFNDNPVRWGIVSYYAITIVTILPISVFLVISKFKTKWIRYSLSIIVCALAFSQTIYKMGNTIEWRDTLKENMFASAFYQANFDVAKINTDLKMIPPDAKICASSSVLPHLSQRMYAYEYPDIENADYIALFTYRDYYLTDDNTYSKVLNNHIFSLSWDIIANDPPFLIMKKIQEGSEKNAVIDSLECGAETISPDKIHFVGSNGELLDNADTRDSLMKHSGNYSICLNKNKIYGFTYHGVNYKAGDFLKITVWKYPAAKDTGRLTVSCGKDFYKTISVGEKNDKNRWEQLEIYVEVPEDHSNFGVYVTNETPVTIWFDDLKIVRCTEK